MFQNCPGCTPPIVRNLSLLAAVIILTMIICVQALSPTTSAKIDDGAVGIADSAEEIDDNTPDTGVVDQEADLGNDPMSNSKFDAIAIAPDTGEFADNAPDTGLAALFVPISNTDAGLEFIPIGIDDGVLPDPPKHFDGFNLDTD